MSQLRIVQLNIEKAKHFDRIYPFFETQNFDVMCLQEFPQSEIEKFERHFGMTSFFAPMARGEEQVIGISIFSRFPILRRYEKQYGGSSKALPQYDGTTFETKHNSSRYVLITCDLEKEGTLFRIGTTHSPVTYRGAATEYQRSDMKRLLEFLQDQKEIVFSGDFNAPRGGEIFSMLAERYQDNVPKEYTSSLDPELHRASKETLEADARAMNVPGQMVDGIFSTPRYQVSNIKMVCGLSDHCALTATITINNS